MYNVTRTICISNIVEASFNGILYFKKLILTCLAVTVPVNALLRGLVNYGWHLESFAAIFYLILWNFLVIYSNILRSTIAKRDSSFKV